MCLLTLDACTWFAVFAAVSLLANAVDVLAVSKLKVFSTEETITNSSTSESIPYISISLSLLNSRTLTKIVFEEATRIMLE